MIYQILTVFILTFPKTYLSDLPKQKDRTIKLLIKRSSEDIIDYESVVKYLGLNKISNSYSTTATSNYIEISYQREKVLKIFLLTYYYITIFETLAKAFNKKR